MTRPDLDNLTKLVLDSANGILWVDDGQVARLEVEKRYGPEARTEIIVRTILDDLGVLA